MFFRQAKKMFLIQIFSTVWIMSLDLKKCLEHSGKLKHASAMDSGSKLSLKIVRNR